MTPEPVIVHALDAFRRRRRRLQLVRGGCAGATALLVAMGVIAVLDRLFLLPDATRMLLSAAGYAVAAVILWRAGLRDCLHRPTPAELAVLMEAAEPGLREELLSAVELSTRSQEARWDSVSLRRLLQRHVAKRLGGLSLDSLLSWRRIRGWLWTAAVTAVVCLILVAIPGLHFGRLLTRALLPAANLDRVSSTRVAVLQPDPQEGRVPRGDPVTFVIETRGRAPSTATLELDTPGERRQRLTMTRIGPGRFSASATANADLLRYRFRAGDAVTRHFTLEPRSRPAVVSFRKEYDHPPYSGLPPRMVQEENGDLSALEGSLATVDFQLNQRVRDISLFLVDEGRTNRYPVIVEPGGRLFTRILLTNAATYRIHLVSAETGFENRFSPQYEIRPIPDLVPRVDLTQPAADLIASPDDVLSLRGAARDDLGLAAVEQWVRVNDGPWRTNRLPAGPVAATNSLTDVEVAARWDLLQTGVRPGDRLLTKLVARDLRGNAGESASVRVLISSPALDPARMRAVEAQRQWLQSLTELKAGAEEARRSADELRQKWRRAGDSDVASLQALMKTRAALDLAGQQTVAAWDRLKPALRQSRAGSEAEALTVAARALARARHSGFETARARLAGLDREDDSNQGQETIRYAVEATHDAVQRINRIAELSTDLVASAAGGLAAENLASLAAEQSRVNRQAATESATDPLAWERLARRQNGAANEVRLVEENLRHVERLAPGGPRERARQFADQLRDSRTQLEKALAAGAPGPSLASPSQQIEKATDSAAAEMLAVVRDLAGRAARARNELNPLAGASWQQLEQLETEVQKLVEARKRGERPPQRNPAAAQLDAKQRQLVGRLDRAGDRWQSSVDELQSRAEAEEWRPDADTRFVNDLTQAALAMQASRNATGGDVVEAHPQLRTVRESLKVLEAWHDLQGAADSVGSLARLERWEADAPSVRTGRPKDWQRSGEALRSAADSASGAGLGAAVADPFRNAPNTPPARTVEEEMQARATPRRAAKAVDEPLSQMAAPLYAILAKARPDIDKARARLAQAAPTLPELMTGLAKQARELENEIRETSRALPTTPPAEARDRSREALEQQSGFNTDLDQLRNALRRDADQQDLATPAGRERARDADDALAMLREPPPRALDHLAQAAMSRDTVRQAESMNKAADQDQRLASQLDQLANHYDNLAAGRPEQSRAALRRAEEEGGNKPELETAYDRAARLANLQQSPANRTLAELEKELAGNPVMRQELGEISGDTTEDAARSLRQSAKQEQQLAGALDQMAGQQNTRRGSLAEQAKQAVAEAKRLAQSEVPTLNRESQAVRADNAPQLDRAGKELAAAAERAPTDFSQPASDLAKGWNQAVAPLQGAEGNLQAAHTAADRVRDAAKAARQQASESEAAVRSAAESASRRVAEASQKSAEAKTAHEQAPTEATAQSMEAVRQAESAARAAAEAAQKAASQAAARSGQAQTGLDQAVGVHARAEKAAQDSAALTRKAREIASSLDALAKSGAAEMARTAQQQEALAPPVQSAGADLARAGRHAERLGRPEGSALQEIGQAAEGIATTQVPSARQSLMQSDQASRAQPAVRSVQKALDQQVQRLDALDAAAAAKSQAGTEASSKSPASSASSASPAESRWMARALDSLDAAMHSRSGEAAPAAAAPELASAMSSQRAALSASRLDRQEPSAPVSQSAIPAEGAQVVAAPLPYGQLPPAVLSRADDWGRLPRKLAQDLMESQREPVAGEYRPQIEAYFRVLAEKAKEKK